MTRPEFGEMLLRILAAFGAGAVIGWERSRRGRPAGLRTTILTCVAAATAMVVSEVLFAEGAATTAGGNWRPDPARFGAGILTGIGFLGAGTIMRHENIVRGVTTAASLWFVTVLGLAFGSGEYALGAVGLVIGFATLSVLPIFERRIQSDRYATITVTASLDGLNEEDLKKRLEALGAHIKGLKVSYDFERKEKKMSLDMRLRKMLVYEACRKMIGELATCQGVREER